MIVDFQTHYTPPELQKGDPTRMTVQLDENGNPNYLLNPLLTDVGAFMRMMDRTGIDACVLSSGPGFDQPDVGKCKLINDRLREIELEHPGRFVGLAHIPALNTAEMIVELKRCVVDLGFPGVVIASEIQGQPLDAEALRPFWRAAADLGIYVFIHPLPNVINWPQMYADDLGRILGWEFSLMTATMRLINSGILDELPHLKVQFSHFSGGLGRYLGRIRGFQQRHVWGTSDIPRHNRLPAKSIDHYIHERLYYDCAGWAGPDPSANWGAEWVRFGLSEVALSQCVFATDYPQAIRDPEEIAGYINAVSGIDANARAVLNGANVSKLIPDIKDRLARRKA